MAGLIIILAFAVVLFLAVYNNLSGTSSAAMDGVMLVAAVGLVAVIGAVLALLVHDEFQKQRLESGRPKYRLNFRRSWRNMWRRWKALILALVTGLGLLLAFKSCTLPETPAPAPSDTPPAAQPAPPPPCRTRSTRREGHFPGASGRPHPPRAPGRSHPPAFKPGNRPAQLGRRLGPTQDRGLSGPLQPALHSGRRTQSHGLGAPTQGTFGQGPEHHPRSRPGGHPEPER